MRASAFLAGAKPSVAKIKMNADPKCVKMHNGKDVESDAVVVNANGTLKNVFIYVKDGLEKYSFDMPTTPVQLDQKSCRYHPHVFGALVNQPIELSRTPSEIRTATPECGEHTDEVMHELGYSDGEIADLRKRIVI